MPVTVLDIFRLLALIRLKKHYPGYLRAFMLHKLVKLQNAFFYFCPVPVDDFFPG